MFKPEVIETRHDLPKSYVVTSQGHLLCSIGAVWGVIDDEVWQRLTLGFTESAYFLGQLNRRNCYVIEVHQCPEIPGYTWENLRSLLGSMSELDYEVASRALQVVTWDCNHQFCSRCGTPTSNHATDRAKCCTSCGLINYPKQSPCIITLVTREDEMLLANNANFTRSYFSALSGFIDAGESVEVALRREVKEEVGIEVGKVHYFSSQSWPFPGQLMIGFHSDYESGEIEVDGIEIVEANWYRYDQLPMVPPAETLSGRLIRDFVKRCHLKHS